MNNWQIRSEMLIGKENIAKLNNATIIIAGLGGVGSWATISLARSGIKNFILIDKDILEISNINRQAIAFSDNIGASKVEEMAKMLKRINPEITTQLLKLNIDKENAVDVASLKADYLIDAVDTITAKASLIKHAYKNQLPVISAMGAGNRLEANNFQVCDISQTYNCPLARSLRKVLRKEGINEGVKVVFDPSEVEKPESWPAHERIKGPRKDLFPPSSMVFAPAISGMLMALEVVKDLIG